MQSLSNTPTSTIPPFHKHTRFAGTHQSYMPNEKTHHTAEIRSNALREGGPTSVIFRLLRSTGRLRKLCNSGTFNKEAPQEAFFENPISQRNSAKPITGRQHRYRFRRRPIFCLMSYCIHFRRDKQDSLRDFACLTE